MSERAKKLKNFFGLKDMITKPKHATQKTHKRSQLKKLTNVRITKLLTQTFA